MDLLHTWDPSEVSETLSSSALSQSYPPTKEGDALICPPLSSKNTPRAAYSDGSSLHNQIIDDDVANVIIDDVECRYTEGLTVVNQQLEQETINAQPYLDTTRDPPFLAFNGNSPTPMPFDIQGSVSKANTAEAESLNLNEASPSDYEIIGLKQPSEPTFIVPFDLKCPQDVMLIESALPGLV